MNDFLDNLYANIGTKIKNFVKWSFFVEVIAILVGSFIMFIEVADSDADAIFPYMLLWPILIIVSVGVAFVSSWVMYAFGDLVENTSETRMRTECIHDRLQNTQAPIEYTNEVKKSSGMSTYDLHKPLPFASQKNTKTDDKWRCPQCHWINSGNEDQCVCGYRR